MAEITDRLSMAPDFVVQYDPSSFRLGDSAIYTVFSTVDLPVYWAAGGLRSVFEHA